MPHMHYGRLATFVLGFWLGAQLAVFYVATGNFRGVDRTLQELPVEQLPSTSPDAGEQLRPLLRFQVSLLNQHYFMRWEQFQFVLVGFLILLFFFHDLRRPHLLLLVSVVGLLILVEHWLLTPELTRLGRAIAFVANRELSPSVDRFWNYHYAYSAVEIVKVGLLVVLSLSLIRRSTRSFHQIDAVNDADDSHVNG